MIDVCPDDNYTMLSSRRVKVDGALEWVAWCWRCRRAWLDDGRYGVVDDQRLILRFTSTHTE